MSLHTHVSTERRPADRGLALGRAQRHAIANTVSFYARLFAESSGEPPERVLDRGREVGERLSAVRPDLVEEIAGIAAGAGQPADMLLAINARTELLVGGPFVAGAGECSTAATTARGCALGQNWDFHPDVAASRLLWIVDPPGRPWFATFTEAGIVAKTGLNEAGVGVTLNFLASAADRGHDGLPVHVLLRMLLDECRTASDAERLVRAARMGASACIAVGSGDERALVAYELSPQGVEGVRPDDGGALAHTNHFVAPGPPDLLAEGRWASCTRDRFEQVRSALRELRQAEPLRVLQEVLSTPPVFAILDPRDPWMEQAATLATVVYDLAARRMWLRVSGDPADELDEVRLPARV